MIPLLVQTYVSFIVFTTFALAALHNITVDDSALTGNVVPQYLSSGSLEWNQGNTCKTCAAQPDPAMAYDGTWHDADYSPLGGPFRSFEFSFAGTALYIYFIVTNAPNPPLSTAVTSVNFTLDGVTSPPFVHLPTPGAAGYQYNVPVFATESLAFETHTMTVQPVAATSAPTDGILMLFDYLIYSTDDADNATTTTMLPVTTAIRSSANPSSSLSPTSPVMSGTSPGPDIGAIVGGAVAGVIAVASVVTSLLCYWRYKRRIGGQSHVTKFTNMVEPFFESQTVPMPVHQDEFPPSQLGSGSKTRGVTPGVTVQPLVPPSSTPPSASGGSSNNVTALIEEMGMLRGEVARLRMRQDREQDLSEVGSVAPPDYFTSES